MESVLKKLQLKANPTELKIWFGAFSILSLIASILTLHQRPYMALATLSYLALLTGVLLRRETKAHAFLMSVGVATDLALVIALEFQRSAIATATSGDLGVLPMGHILFSVLAVTLYLPTMYFGVRAKKWRGSENQYPYHLILGRTAFLFRTVGFFLMFSLFSHLNG